jgi:hypothetical protein
LKASDAKPETLRQDVEAVADLHDAPGFFLLGEERGEGGGVFGRNAELAGKRLFIQRLVVGAGQEGNEGLAPMERSRRFVFPSVSRLALRFRSRSGMTLRLRRMLRPRRALSLRRTLGPLLGIGVGPV